MKKLFFSMLPFSLDFLLYSLLCHNCFPSSPVSDSPATALSVSLRFPKPDLLKSKYFFPFLAFYIFLDLGVGRQPLGTLIRMLGS